jgi:protein-S-isoprenylcysteine O-methyltransferase Ste14
VARQLRAILLLPFVAVVVVPLLIHLGGDGLEVDSALLAAPGALLIAAGLMLMYRTITLFARIGQGTLAPWDPTRRLVVAGPYCYVRNPMISGVMAIRAGEALLFGSPDLAIWLAVFFAANALWFPLVEEPGLVRRFGRDYEEYRRAVPRWIPRRTPWTPGV